MATTTRSNSGPTYATRTSGPTYATRTSGLTYAKIIGDGCNKAYTYRVGLNTLMDGETFDPRPVCGPGGLYFCDIRYICEWMGYGDQLCIVKPLGQIVAVDRKFKTDRLEIVSMMSLSDADTWKFLVENGADIHVVNYIALRWAAYHGHPEVVKFLVDHGADIHAREDQALRWAAGKGHFEVVKFLVEKGADIHARCDDTLISAAAWGHLEVVKFLVEHGADIYTYNGDALRLAKAHGHLEVAKFLEGLML